MVEIATREAVLDESVLQDLLQRAGKVPIARDEIKRVDRSKCNTTQSHLFV